MEAQGDGETGPEDVGGGSTHPGGRDSDSQARLPGIQQVLKKFLSEGMIAFQ